MRSGGRCSILPVMELQIVLNGLDPPSGRGVVDGHDAWTFAGWLELIERVERFKDECGSAEPDDDSGGVA